MKRRREYPVLFYIVPLVILISIVLYPLVYSLVNSFRVYNFIHPEWGHPFIWFENFGKILSDPEFYNAFKVTLVFTVAAVAIELVLGLALVALFGHITRGISALRTLLIIPMVVAPSLAAVMWRWMYNPQLGIINYIMSLLGIEGIAWAGSGTALLALIIVDVWQWTPFIFLIVHAGYLSLPKMPFEAARVDGMSTWQELRIVTLPLLLPSILIAVLLRLIYAIQVFEYPFIITEGGPGVQTETVNIYLYRRLFMMNDVGMASAGSWLFLVVIIAFSQVIIRNILKSEKWR